MKTTENAPLDYTLEIRPSWSPAPLYLRLKLDPETNTERDASAFIKGAESAMLAIEELELPPPSDEPELARPRP